MTDSQTGYTDPSSVDMTAAPGTAAEGGGGTGTTTSHSELFGLQGQKRASTTAGAGAGSGIIGTSGHSGSANKPKTMASGMSSQNAGVAGIEEGGNSSTISGSGGDTLTPSQGSGDVRPGGEATGEKKLLDKINPFK